MSHHERQPESIPADELDCRELFQELVEKFEANPDSIRRTVADNGYGIVERLIFLGDGDRSYIVEREYIRDSSDPTDLQKTVIEVSTKEGSFPMEILPDIIVIPVESGQARDEVHVADSYAVTTSSAYDHQNVEKQRLKEITAAISAIDPEPSP